MSNVALTKKLAAHHRDRRPAPAPMTPDSQRSLTGDGARPLEGSLLTEAISEAMIDLYAEFYGHERTTAATYINDNVVVCVLENILSEGESLQVAAGNGSDVIDGRVAFQRGAEDAFTAAVERLTQRPVTAFMSANQTTPGVACELFFLEAPPVRDT